MGNGNTKPLGNPRLAPRRSVPLLLALLFSLLASPSFASADFGISTFTLAARNANGTVDELAGSHPFALDVDLALNTDETGEPDGILRTFQLDLPASLLGNPLAAPRCPLVVFEAMALACDSATQIGVLRATFGEGQGQLTLPVYNVGAAPGYAATFGVKLSLSEPLSQQITLIGSGAGSSVRISGTLPDHPPLLELEEEIWGVPGDPAHDVERSCYGTSEGCQPIAERPLLTLPASCAGAIPATLTASSYDSATATASAVFRDAGGNPRPPFGCDAVPFDPRFTVATEATALSPTSLAVGLEVPQYEGGTAAATVAGIDIQLPKGLVLNPAAGAWLSGCSPDAIGLETAPGVEPPSFDGSAAACPASARLGSVTLRTPLTDHGLGGAIYLAAPGANPFDTRYAAYLVIEDPGTSTVIKIPARLIADPVSGRLAVAIPELPPLPFEDLELEFAGGPQAPLANSSGCGRYETEAAFTPSTAPLGPTVSRNSGFTVSATAGKPCPPPEAERDADPSFRAGTENSRAGGESPLVIDLSREDVDQHFGSFTISLPPGLIANLGSVPVGAAVGSVRARAGLGPQPSVLNGNVYLGGPYRGSPYSLEVVVPAKIGPFDLGTIVQRAAVSVDPVTAQISVSSDPLPQILGGVPLQLRSLRLDLDRPGFVRNPTSCERMAITGSATSSLGQAAPLSARFQVGNCAALPFEPKASLDFSGALGRNGHPGVRAVLRADPGDAALASADFTLPAGELLDLRHLRGLCPRGVPVGGCPSQSRLGRLRLESPFADGAVEGPIYLREPSRGLPGLVAELRSGQLRFLIRGRTAVADGRLAVRFDSLPDIPLSRAVLSLAGGRRGVVVNSRSLCSRPSAATVTVTAHNGMHRRLDARPRLKRSC